MNKTVEVLEQDLTGIRTEAINNIEFRLLDILGTKNWDINDVMNLYTNINLKHTRSMYRILNSLKTKNYIRITKKLN